MSTTQQKDDDLLIISDNGDTLDFGIKNDQEDDFSFIIEEDEPIIFEDNVDSKKEENNSLVIDNSLDLTKDSLLDLKGNLSSEGEKEPKQEEKLELDGDFSFENLVDNNENKSSESEKIDISSDLSNLSSSLNNQNKEEKSLEDILENKEEKLSKNLTEDTKVGDMSEILGRTIYEFEQRENIINDDISEKENHISALEKELNTEREIVADLKSEKLALEKNRKSLEKMKTDFENREEEKVTTKKVLQK